jgi:hypothetical protein
MIQTFSIRGWDRKEKPPAGMPEASLEVIDELASSPFRLVVLEILRAQPLEDAQSAEQELIRVLISDHVSTSAIGAADLRGDDGEQNRHLALSFCLSVLFVQTLRACREGKMVLAFPDHAPATLLLVEVEETVHTYQSLEDENKEEALDDQYRRQCRHGRIVKVADVAEGLHGQRARPGIG